MYTDLHFKVYGKGAVHTKVGVETERPELMQVVSREEAIIMAIDISLLRCVLQQVEAGLLCQGMELVVVRGRQGSRASFTYKFN